MGFNGGGSEIADGSISIAKLASNVLDPIFSQQIEQDLNILINSIAATSSLEDYSEMVVDIFNFAEGASVAGGTIDIGNTTAIFNTDNYANSLSSIEDAHGVSFVGSDSAQTHLEGFKIHTNGALTLTKVTKSATVTADTAYLYNSSVEEISSASFVGNDATFSDVLTADTDYYILVKNANDSAYTRHFHNAGISYPYNDTNINWTGGYAGADTSTEVYCIENITTSGIPANTIIQTNMETLASAPTKYYVYAKNSVAGSGEAKARLSFDNGSTWEDDTDLFTIQSYSGSGTQMIAQIKLNGTGAGNTAEASNYGVVVI